MIALALTALAATPWSAMSDGQRNAALEKLEARPLAERLVEISQGYLGTPYQLSPLGEGKGVDPDPLIRHDLVDCLTLVEQSMAMALSKKPDGVLELLNDIRYGGPVAFETRNHLMEAQWLPDNVAAGRLKDLTAELFPAAVAAQKTLDAAAWSGAAGRALNLAPKDRPSGTHTLKIIPVDDALPVLARAPDGAVVVVVRKDRPTAVTRVTHVGFLVHKKSGPHLRHASRTFKRAVDEELSRYIARNLGYARWTVEGFAVFEVTEPPAGKRQAASVR